MTDQDWQHLEKAFTAAVALDGEAREAFVRAFAESHPQLLAQLEAMLGADTGGDTRLRDSIAASVESLSAEKTDPWIGRQFGPWTIRKRLAGGGMGAVFLADRADEAYTQTAALKLMSAQLHSPSAIARFKAERQILANLSHPNIGRLLDGGSTDTGVPFLVMEFIDGEPIDDYCETHVLSVEQRLQLMRKVCDAVDYAHRHLIIHRDLKPSNILVDGNGEPKLLDFGIAKLLDPGDYDIAETRVGTRAMTPEYASPEQVRGESISTATDVYALGVLLFRLMTGQSPYGQKATSPHDYEQAIVGEAPRKPSTAVTAVGESGISSVPPERLRRLLLGDLDNIVLKALQKEPARRYPTAVALSEDIRRYLDNEPVSARGDEALYRLGKFIRRNARGVITGVAVFATIVALVTFYTLQLADERDRATAAATQAREVSEFLTRLFESASPHEAKGEVITAVDLLEEGQARIEELQTQPEVQAELMRIMASSMTVLGYRERAIPMLQRVLEMKEAQVPRDRYSISLTTNNLAEAHRQLRQLEKAEEYMLRTIEIAHDLFGPTDHNVAYLTARLGVIQFDAYRNEEALKNQQHALELFIANDEGESSAAIDTRGNLANSLARLGRYEEAETLHRETIALSEKVVGERAPNTNIRKNNLTLVLAELGKLDEAIANSDEVLAQLPGIWPDGNDQFGWTARARARPLLLQGRIDEAIAQYRLAVDVMRANHGENSPVYASRLRELGRGLMLAGRYGEAATVLQEALAIEADIRGDNGPDAVPIELNLARLDARRGRLEEAQRRLRRVLPLSRESGHLRYLAAQTELDDVLSRQDRFAEAGAVIDAALEAHAAVPGGSKPALLSTLAVATAHYRRADDLETSLAYGERIRNTLEEDPHLLFWSGALALAEYGLTLRAANDAGADAVLNSAMSVLVSALGEDDPRVQALRQQRSR